MPIDNAPTDFELGSRRDSQSKMDGRRARSVLLSAALAAGVPPALIRLLGRWSSDCYEIYCRMSEEAALRAGTALASSSVSTFEGAFHEEHLELLPQEVDLLGQPSGGPGSGSDDDAA